MISHKAKYSKGEKVVCKKDYIQSLGNDSEEMCYLICEKGEEYTIDKIVFTTSSYTNSLRYNVYYRIKGIHFKSKEVFDDECENYGVSGTSGSPYPCDDFNDYFVRNKKDIPIEWDDYFINLTEQIKLKSKDESTKIGAIIVNDDHQILSTGYNSFPRGANDDLKERQERPEKYFWFEHAERNAIYAAAMVGTALKGSTMYLSSQLPCMDCARAIVGVGIKRVYCKNYNTTQNKEKWEIHSKKSLQLFDECGVDVVYY